MVPKLFIIPIMLMLTLIIKMTQGYSVTCGCVWYNAADGVRCYYDAAITSCAMITPTSNYVLFSVALLPGLFSNDVALQTKINNATSYLNNLITSVSTLSTNMLSQQSNTTFYLDNLISTVSTMNTSLRALVLSVNSTLFSLQLQKDILNTSLANATAYIDSQEAKINQLSARVEELEREKGDGGWLGKYYRDLLIAVVGVGLVVAVVVIVKKLEGLREVLREVKRKKIMVGNSYSLSNQNKELLTEQTNQAQLMNQNNESHQQLNPSQSQPNKRKKRPRNPQKPQHSSQLRHTVQILDSQIIMIE